MPIFDYMPFGVVYQDGFTIERIKQWRTERHDAGLPSSYEDFFAAHGFCVHCHAAGRLITGICWRDANGDSQYMEIISPGVPMGIAELHEREGENSSDWEHTYAPCDACQGTGRSAP